MAFLFKTKNKQGLPNSSRNLTSADGAAPSSTQALASAKDAEKLRLGASSAMGSMIARGATPDQVNLQGPRPNATSPPQRPAHDMSLYPWSQKRLDFTSLGQNPFPRYGAASNSVASPKGDIYLMGGLINGAMVKGDLWVVEAGSSGLACAPVATMAEGPGPRVGHAALLVGNAFIVFGGDTKIEEMDVLDDTLYLLNTSTKHWSRALPAGQRPAGRYGHTLNILGSKIYIFGGQVEGYFFNDLVAFDLNALQQPSNRWEILIHNTSEGGPPQGQSPPARTNHTIITWNDKLYLFGGTDGIHWFNDVWTYDPRSNSWTPQECIGFIPAAREGHAAALVGDVMYVFGGRTEEGKDLGDLAAFRIPTRRWYTFQNMGPSPSPRSGHGMTAHGQYIYVLAGEPSSAPREPSELSLTYVLDTSKIRYPTDQPGQQAMNGTRSGSRRPSIGDRSATPQDRSASREGMYSNGVAKWHRNGSQDSVTDQPQQATRGPDTIPPGSNFSQGALAGRQPRGPAAPPPQGPPPNVPVQQQQQQQQQPGQQSRVNGAPRPFAAPDGRESPRMGQRSDRPMGPPEQGPQRAVESVASVQRDQVSGDSSRPQPSTVMPGQFSLPRSGPGSESYVAATTQSTAAGSVGSGSQAKTAGPGKDASRARSRQGQQGSIDGSDRTLKTSEDISRSQTDQSEKAVTPQNQYPVDSGVGSSPSLNHQHPQNVQHEDLTRELEAARTKNAWFASELALAQKAGYSVSTHDSSTSDDRNSSLLGEEEKPLIEALVKMRNELVNVQENLATQQNTAAEKIAQVEKERDAAISEAVYARTRYAARMGKSRGLEDNDNSGGPENYKAQETNRRLATSLQTQNDLQARIKALTAEMEAERRARQVAEESADTAHSRASELDTHKQQSSSELESLRVELHDAQQTAREQSASAHEALGSSQLLQVERNELTSKLAVLEEATKNHTSMMGSLQEAVTASADKATLLERKLEHERRERTNTEEKLAQLKSEHEARVIELETTSRRLQDAEELAASHATEARTHREAVLAGFGKSTERSVDDNSGHAERAKVLQERLDSANSMVRSNQEAADRAAERLRRAEERIAGLEAYQEQASRESLNMRKQLQQASREAVALHSEKVTLQQQLTSEKMDSTALQVQHSAVRDLLHERGIDANSLPKSRGLDAGNAPSDDRFRELEQQLEASTKAHEEMRSSFEQREQEANRGWEQKLAALDNDYQAAVKYLKGTENMLSKMKQELHRYKTTNKDLKEELARERKSSASPEQGAAWEQERGTLQKQIDGLQSRVTEHQTQLEQQMSAVRDANAERDTAQQALNAALKQHTSELGGLREQNGALERRATEAEGRVQTLLDTVHTSVNNYRRQSAQVNGLHPHPESAAEAAAAEHTSHLGHSRGFSASSIGGESNYSNMTGMDGAADARNSMALDSLASELETLRSHWVTTTQNYRSSGQSMQDRTPTAASGATQNNESLSSWRRKLDLDEKEEARQSSDASRGT